MALYNDYTHLQIPNSSKKYRRDWKNGGPRPKKNIPNYTRAVKFSERANAATHFNPSDEVKYGRQSFWPTIARFVKPDSLVTQYCTNTWEQPRMLKRVSYSGHLLS